MGSLAIRFIEWRGYGGDMEKQCFIMTREALENKMAVPLGGRAAE